MSVSGMSYVPSLSAFVDFLKILQKDGWIFDVGTDTAETSTLYQLVLQVQATGIHSGLCSVILSVYFCF